MKVNIYIATPETAEGQLDLVAGPLASDSLGTTLEYARAAALLNPNWQEITICREPTKAEPA